MKQWLRALLIRLRLLKPQTPKPAANVAQDIADYMNTLRVVSPLPRRALTRGPLRVTPADVDKSEEQLLRGANLMAFGEGCQGL